MSKPNGFKYKSRQHILPQCHLISLFECKNNEFQTVSAPMPTYLTRWQESLTISLGLRKKNMRLQRWRFHDQILEFAHHMCSISRAVWRLWSSQRAI
uniref:Uncharacterized protein n=1 Tax=Tanacetum cinerariifolium TaxID=118510 RepID=A0A6L2JUC8_TANCI|nr:hypothetical protein [Tanacetum cinerariifolium]